MDGKSTASMILVKVQSAYNDDNWNYKPSNVFACLQLVETHHMIENTQAKNGESTKKEAFVKI